MEYTEYRWYMQAVITNETNIKAGQLNTIKGHGI